MWLENGQEPCPGRFYKCSKDLQIHEPCCNLIVRFVPCTKASSKGMDRVKVKHISRPDSSSLQRESLFVTPKSTALNGNPLMVFK